MSFDYLHSAIQHHIVNSLGWQSLRPLQEQSIKPILNNKHCLLLAPTAGGKTEAAIFPVLSKILSHNWSGLSVIYVCPIKALLNDLQIRLESYCSLVGRRCKTWHGDISSSKRKKILRDPPDCLLTTPESLEVMLVSNSTDHNTFFSSVKVCIVDEIHAFAGDDRGWHLLAVLERINRIAETNIQRIGLSATVGNPEELLDWYTASSNENSVVIQPVTAQVKDVQIQLDYVGSIENAAIVISRIFKGEKRLVFIDSRSGVEKISSQLRELDVNVFVSHSSLSASERRKAEEAFKESSNCVIVATSTLELGIDVGDLDRVIQIDCPSSVASFLQRLGRTGRRKGSFRNCLFLATNDYSLVQAAALLRLWKTGYVEPIIPPQMPYHIFAQQLMALALQEHGIGVESWQEWLGQLLPFSDKYKSDLECVIRYMIDEKILFSDNGNLWFDEIGEKTFGYRNFMELLSIFTSPPLFEVRHGKDILGFIQEVNFLTEDKNVTILLGGQNWDVTGIEWNKKVAHVVPSKRKGKSRWLGSKIMLSYMLCQSMADILSGVNVETYWSKRAIDKISDIRDEFGFIESTCLAVVSSKENDTCWWTFAGKQVNLLLAKEVENQFNYESTADNMCIKFSRDVDREKFVTCIESLKRKIGSGNFQPPVIKEAIEGLKFSKCLPMDILIKELASRSNDIEVIKKVLNTNIKFVYE